MHRDAWLLFSHSDASRKGSCHCTASVCAPGRSASRSIDLVEASCCVCNRQPSQQPMTTTTMKLPKRPKRFIVIPRRSSPAVPPKSLQTMRRMHLGPRQVTRAAAAKKATPAGASVAA